MAEPQETYVAYSPWVPDAEELARALVQRLCQSGPSRVCSLLELEQLQQELSGIRFLATVGGDGTILQAVRVTAPLEVPLVGINLGRVGFMAELSAEQALEGICSYLQEDIWLEKRSMLQAKVLSSQATPPVAHGLNDAVVGRAQVARLVHLEVSVDGRPLFTYAGDGAIVATATGSTGYSLSAGGPILYPESPSLIVKPVAPQLSLNSALVLPPEAVVQITVLRADQPAAITVDGYMDTPLVAGNAVQIERSPYVAHFLRMGPRPHFPQALTQRLSSPTRESN